MTYTREQILENRRKWIEALRSGKFKQCKQVLRKQNGSHISFCCLGVATEISGLCTVDGNFYLDETEALSYSALLPPCVQDWLNITTIEGRYIDKDGSANFLTVNNDSGKSFDEIADIIESNPKGLWREEVAATEAESAGTGTNDQYFPGL
jgi:hypothetical protein